MSNSLGRYPLSKKNKRQVSTFLGNELLYDYVCGVLDEERVRVVEALLQTSKESQAQLDKIKSGLEYTKKMREIQVSPLLREKITTPSSYLSVLFQKARIHEWPVGIRWGLESLIVVFVIVTFLTLAPWEKVLNIRFSSPSNEVILAEINKKNSVGKSAEISAPLQEVPEFVDEGLKTKEDSVLPALVTSPPLKNSSPEKAVVAKAALKEAPKEETKKEATKDSGFLYRGKISVVNLDAVGPKIKDKIVELGGRKAGEVDLGWQKTAGSAYFHFTVPEEKYSELQSFLSEYGHASIGKEKHSRVMPDGIIRLIITVDEAKK